MNVLSLFDGISCGMIALDRAGIKVDRYYASEIDPYASKVSAANYPNIIRLGDVKAWESWKINWFEIDLIIAGSPCQGFSFAGKQLAFDDPRSKLFFEFVKILNHVRLFNPNVKFMLENVRMKKEYLDTITDILGVDPMCINSSLVSAQNRVRYYWFDWEVDEPEDLGIRVVDILSDNGYGIGSLRGRFKIDGVRQDKKGVSVAGKTTQELECRTDHKSNCLSTVQKDNVVLLNESSTKTDKAYAVTASYSGAVAWNSCERKQRTMIPVEESQDETPNVYNGVRYRKLTPIECERLQTVPDNYTNHVSKTQRYKMLGNGWTVDVVAHIFNGLK